MKYYTTLLSLTILLLTLAPVRGEERIDMDAISIIGNKELPNILYILPWKQADLPEMSELPLSSLIDDALKPIDRQTMLRRQYYKQIIKQQGAPAAPVAGKK